MDTTSPKWLYRFFALITAYHCLIAVPLYIDFFLHPLEPDPLFNSVWVRALIALIVVPIGLTISILVIRRTPRNVNGLFLLLLLTLIINGTIRDNYEIRVLASAGGFGWTGLWLLFLYFPDGRAFPRRFEQPLNLLSIGFMMSVILWYFASPSLNNGQIRNLLAIPALEGLFPIISTLQTIILLIIALVIIPSLVLRYRHSDFQTRQQLKWLCWIFVSVIVVATPLGVTGKLTGNELPSGIDFILLILFVLFVYVGSFLAIGNAILRYKLYDIDIIIRRTFIYSVVSVLLVSVYGISVIITQRLFQLLIGESSEISVVLSTLFVVVLFTPMRRRVQDVIDRRFYRRKYNVEQVLAEFNATVAEEVDIEALKSKLMHVIGNTMQPSSMALWIKEPTKNNFQP